MLTVADRDRIIEAWDLDLKQRHQAIEYLSGAARVVVCRDLGCGMQPFPCRVAQMLDGEATP